MPQVCIAFGSNVGDRESYIRSAIELIKQSSIISDIKISKMLNTKALLKKGSPKSWDMDFINCVLIGETEFGPHALLQELFKVERFIGGAKMSWAPRKLDIDMLLYGNLSVATPTLILPHQELLNRKFLIDLIVDIDPSIKYTGDGFFYGKTFSVIKEELNADENV